MAHKACDPFTPMGFPQLSLRAVPFKHRSQPKEGLEISKCESLLPSIGTAT